jgi:dephospho-CoA kinase
LSERTPPVLGITGAVASGKSALSRRLAALGADVIDVDGLGHDVLAAPHVRDAVVRQFGRSVRAPDRSLDRAALARIAFANESARKHLEEIVHPEVRTLVGARLDAARAAGAPLVVLDCALLFEGALDALCDRTVAVEAPETVRFARALAAHGWDADEVRRRMAAQFPPHEKRARADEAVVNDGDEARLADAARSLYDNLVRGGDAGPARRTTR